MFGNKYQGDELAKEFYRLTALKKMASDGDEEKENLVADLQNHVEEEVVSAADFLNELDDEPADLTEGLEAEVGKLDSWSSNIPTDEPGSLEDRSMYQNSHEYLLDQRATSVLNGLGKIAGSLQQRGEGFAADIVQATANSIREDMVKEASKKLETVNILSKIASDISKSGDQFTSDIVTATINKIKKAQWTSDYEEAEGGPETEPGDLCEKCIDDEEENPEQATGEFKGTPLCQKHLEDAHYWEGVFSDEDKHTRFHEGGGADWGDGSSSYPEEKSDFDDREGGW